MQHIELKTTPNHEESHLFIGAHSLEQISTLCDLAAYSRVFVLSDKTVAPLCLDKLLHALPADTVHFLVPAGESAKTIDTVQSIWKAMHAADCDRKTVVINLGGGVICDIGGFAASTYMRGVDFVHVPTTLLAQVDASVGGKTGIDFDGIKNLIGTFIQPRAIIIDPLTLETLPEREFVAGFGEIIKHGLISSRTYLEQVTKKTPLEYSAAELEEIIARSCRIKADVVRHDTLEGGLRQTVNFGHTVGHAIEALSLETSQPLLHGEAIAIGMVIEADLSYRKGLLSATDAGLVGEYFHHAGLPVVLPNLSVSKLLKLMRSDKKNRAGSLRFTLLTALGQAEYGHEVSPELIEEVLKEHLQRSGHE